MTFLLLLNLTLPQTLFNILPLIRLNILNHQPIINLNIIHRLFTKIIKEILIKKINPLLTKPNFLKPQQSQQFHL